MKRNLKLFAFILGVALLLSACAYASEETEELSEEWKLKTRSESYNRVVTIGDKSFVYYAQNSPEYEKIWVGDGFLATVGDSCCACFSLANAVVNSSDYDALPLIRENALYPIKIDTHNILMGHGTNEDLSYEIDRTEDYFRYFPLALINNAGGNNKSYGNRFASPGQFKKIFETLHLKYAQTSSLNECVEEIQNNGALVIVCSGSEASPLAPKFGHYLVMASVQGENVYFLDSVYREEYTLDKKGIIHVQEPGVIYVDKADLKRLCLFGTKYIVYPSELKTTYTQSDYDDIIKKSNTKMEDLH